MKGLVYEEEFKNGVGRLEIRGLYFPNAKEYDFLSKAWSSLCRRILDEYKIRVTAGFYYEHMDDGSLSVKCSFLINTSTPDNGGVYVKGESDRRFEESFHEQMAMFKNIIEKFFDEPECGYKNYTRLVKEGNSSIEECDAFFNIFLKKIGVRTEEDEEAIRAKAQDFAQALEASTI